MNPLDSLLPPIAPPPAPWWPPAPGWWLLALALLLTVGGLYLLRRRLRRRPLRPTQLDPLRLAALHELDSLEKPYGREAGPWLQQINALLKRLCVQRYPQSQCQTLSGRAWLAFLDSRCPSAGLTRWMVLVEGAYRPRCQLDDKALQALHQAIDLWIRKHV